MNILMMGGTVFLGRAIVESAIAAGHTVTLFNRGQSNPDLFPDLEKLVGNRLESDLEALKGRSFDAIIDPSAYVPRVVNELLTTVSTKHYTLISSISAYLKDDIPNQDETAQTATMADAIAIDSNIDPDTEEITGLTYGPLKVLCEQAAETHLPNQTLHVRAGLIVGPHDKSDRFTYWPHRISQGGTVLAPGNPNEATQFIDVRDLADWIIHCVEANTIGFYNATGPAQELTMQALFETISSVTESDASFVWANDAFLLENEVAPYVQMPLWVPAENYSGFNRYNIDKALKAGLTFRPLKTTIKDTLAYSNSRPSEYEWRGGLTPDKEKELLQKLSK